MSALVPENGTRVFCRLSDYKGDMFWYERKVLGNTDDSKDFTSGKILVDSGDNAYQIIATNVFVRVDSVEGKDIQQNQSYIPLS